MRMLLAAALVAGSTLVACAATAQSSALAPALSPSLDDLDEAPPNLSGRPAPRATRAAGDEVGRPASVRRRPDAATRSFRGGPVGGAPVLDEPTLGGADLGRGTRIPILSTTGEVEYVPPLDVDAALNATYGDEGEDDASPAPRSRSGAGSRKVVGAAR